MTRDDVLQRLEGELGSFPARASPLIFTDTSKR